MRGSVRKRAGIPGWDTIPEGGKTVIRKVPCNREATGNISEISEQGDNIFGSIRTATWSGDGTRPP